MCVCGCLWGACCRRLHLKVPLMVCVCVCFKRTFELCEALRKGKMKRNSEIAHTR